MVSEDNLEHLRRHNAWYIVGAPKAKLKQFGRELEEKTAWQEVESGLEVKLIEPPDAVRLHIEEDEGRRDWAQAAQ